MSADRSSSKRPGALGRGLAALIPGDVLRSSSPAGARQLRVPLDSIVPNPEQPRRHFDDTALQELSRSIREEGLLQPLLVREQGDRYVLLAGERRWRAAGLAGLLEIPVMVHESDSGPGQQLLLALIENLQRSDLDPIEEALGYQRLSQVHGLTQEEISSKVGKDRATIANFIRLLRLPSSVQQALSEGLISTGHAKALLAMTDSARIPALLELVLARGLSVRALERLVQQQNRTAETPRQPATPLKPWKHAETLLGRSLGAPVEIRSKRDGAGSIVIRYGSQAELTALVERLRGPG